MLVFFFSVSWMLIAMDALHTSAYNKFDLLNKLSNDHLIWIVEKMCQMKILIYLPGEWLTTIQIVDKHHFNTFCSYFFLLFALRLFTFCLCNTVFLRFPFNHITTVFLSYFSLLPSAHRYHFHSFNSNIARGFAIQNSRELTMNVYAPIHYSDVATTTTTKNPATK